jgi:hypothetical protein
MQVTATRDSHNLLALATLGGVTEIGSFQFMLCHPRWLRQVSSASCVSMFLTLSPKKHCQCKQTLNNLYLRSKMQDCGVTTVHKIEVP